MVVLLSAIATGGVRAARTAQIAASNRISLERTRWAAETCAVVAVARLDSLARARSEFGAISADSLVFANGTSCALTAHDASALRRPYTADRDSGTVNANEAPPEVLAALPGFTAEAVAVVLERRRWRQRIASLDDLTARISRSAHDSIASRYGELHRLLTFRTTSLVLTVEGRDVRPRPVSTIELYVVPVGSRVAVIRRVLTW